ncbi:spaetzle-processing enzyme [Drosophila santomea]|uniref:spaetzle-processing enzyme n=1 Tax=Drosophila santomea TaxID=129105 RepID=UPI0019531B27|nr:spaetzle-processing enzyme [Drosophila santomea]
MFLALKTGSSIGILIFLMVHLAYPDNVCQQDETCVRLQDCPQVYVAVKTNRLSRATKREILNNWRCGSSVRKQKLHHRTICCPEPADILPRLSACGQMKMTFRIMGGTEPDLNQYPWLTMLLYRNLSTPRRKLVPGCSGSLINTRYVLTAAHCVTNANMNLRRVRLGEHNTSQNPDCINVGASRRCAPPHLDIDVESVTSHEDYDPAKFTLHNDVALVRLQVAVRYTVAVHPICVPDDHISQRNFKFRVAGWGRTGMSSDGSDVLQHALLKEQNPRTCSQFYAHWHFQPQSQICAGGLDAMSTCDGDSGSPLMGIAGRGYDEYTFLAGIVSYGRSCGQSAYPAVFTRTATFFKWTLEHLKP